jgi:hypothetical protein
MLYFEPVFGMRLGGREGGGGLRVGGVEIGTVTMGCDIFFFFSSSRWFLKATPGGQGPVQYTVGDSVTEENPITGREGRKNDFEDPTSRGSA